MQSKSKELPHTWNKIQTLSPKLQGPHVPTLPLSPICSSSSLPLTAAALFSKLIQPPGLSTALFLCLEEKCHQNRTFASLTVLFSVPSKHMSSRNIFAVNKWVSSKPEQKGAKKYRSFPWITHLDFFFLILNNYLGCNHFTCLKPQGL